MKIVKHSGSIVNFDRNKLKRSLMKSGADNQIVGNVLETIEKELYDGISTRQIYKLAFALLKRISGSHAARYNLRTAIQQLGPAGFFFEKFVARIFSLEEYQTKTNLNLTGHCVSHEIDIAVRKNGVTSMVECKFHSTREANSDVKVPMYILSRFNDLKIKPHNIFVAKDQIQDCIIVTNNRFTSDAITFAECSGIKLLSWDYPVQNNLKSKIDDNNLYPVTCLTTLTAIEKQNLLILDVVLVSELLTNIESLSSIGLSPIRVKNVLKEASQLCKYI